MTDWQPIETAPKDGTEVLICTWDGVVKLAGFDHTVPHPAFIDDLGDSHFGVSHWMPIPRPPERGA